MLFLEKLIRHSDGCLYLVNYKVFEGKITLLSIRAVMIDHGFYVTSSVIDFSLFPDLQSVAVASCERDLNAIKN
jgi:hypothetical protein